MECVLCIVVYLTTKGPNEFGNHVVPEICFRYNGDALDACLIHKEVFSPCDYKSQAMMIAIVSSSSSSMYLGNKYISHSSFSSLKLV